MPQSSRSPRSAERPRPAGSEKPRPTTSPDSEKPRPTTSPDSGAIWSRLTVMAGTDPSGCEALKGRLVGQTERTRDHIDELLGCPEQVIGLAGGDRPGDARLGRGPLGRTGREEDGPLRQLRVDRTEQGPDTGQSVAPAR